LLFFLGSFGLGALHAATPGHGKTVSAAYVVGARGRPVDAVTLGVFVTLSHTSGLVLVAAVAALGVAWLAPERVQTYLNGATALLVTAVGVWLLLGLRRRAFRTTEVRAHHHEHDGHEHEHHGHEHERHGHEHGHALHRHVSLPSAAEGRPSLGVLLWLGVAGGLVPDPAALALLLAAFAAGATVVGMLAVVAFSLGFAAVLVAVGVAAAHAGRLVRGWMDGRWQAPLELATACLIVVVGLVLTAMSLPGLLQTG
jgi:nickel/cobalt transporter (NicO) family protein